MANNTILAMNALQSNIIREITPLSDKDCFYIAERYKTEFTYPIHNHAEFELNFTAVSYTHLTLPTKLEV